MPQKLPFVKLMCRKSFVKLAVPQKLSLPKPLSVGEKRVE
jgi:hypothetical protein